MQRAAFAVLLMAASCPGASSSQTTDGTVAPEQDAQAAPTGTTIEVPSPVLTLDQERFFVNSAWGRRVAAEIDAASADLAAENRRIEGELTAEEKALTEDRKTADPAAFRVRADAFDAKVVAIRAEQDQKGRDLAARRDSERQAFFAAALPVLGEVMSERGAVAILDARAIFVAVNGVDVTDQLIAAMDARIGPGPAAPSAGDPTMPAPTP
jgi:Skp family chaperone for outer membrane proteins